MKRRRVDSADSGLGYNVRLIKSVLEVVNCYHIERTTQRLCNIFIISYRWGVTSGTNVVGRKTVQV